MWREEGGGCGRAVGDGGEEAWRGGWAWRRMARRSTVNNPGSTRAAIGAATITTTGHILVWERLRVPPLIHPPVCDYCPGKKVKGHMLTGSFLAVLEELVAANLAGPYYRRAL